MRLPLKDKFLRNFNLLREGIKGFKSLINLNYNDNAYGYELN